MIFDTALHIASWALLSVGSVFVVIGALGIVRMPDVFTRLHAASLIETLGGGCILVGLMLQAGLTLVTLKLVAVMLLFIFTAPVATHAVAQAALHQEVKPKLASDRRPHQVRPQSPTDQSSETR